MLLRSTERHPKSSKFIYHTQKSSSDVVEAADNDWVVGLKSWRSRERSFRGRASSSSNWKEGVYESRPTNLIKPLVELSQGIRTIKKNRVDLIGSVNDPLTK